MGYTRFRNSIKVCKGVHINLNKDSVGLSVGVPGLGYTVNSKGRQTTHVGIPGTGLSYISTKTKNDNVTNKEEKRLVTNLATSDELISINKLCATRIYEKNDYIKEINNLKAEKNEHNQQRNEEKEEHLRKIIEGDEESICDIINSWFNGLELPFECNLNYEYKKDTNELFIDLDLPEIEDFPNEKTIQLSDNTTRIDKKTIIELNQDYKKYVFGLALFIVSHIFNISPNIRKIIISGYTQRRNSEDIIKNEYVYSIKFDREKLNQYDLRKLNSFDVCMNFENRCKVKDDHSLEMIQPFLDNKCNDKGQDQKLYVSPNIELLSDEKNKEVGDDLNKISRTIEQTLSDFDVVAKVEEVMKGPIATTYGVKPLKGNTRIKYIKALKDDIAIALGREVSSINRIPGTGLVGIEVTNNDREIVSFRKLLKSKRFKKSEEFEALLGKDYYGRTKLLDISNISHMLIAGTTGSGKSMLLHSIILSLLYKCDFEKLKFVFVDTKGLELMPYGKLPHALSETIRNPNSAIGYLEWLVEEMHNRYKLFSEAKVRNIKEYNDRNKEKEEKNIPQIIVIIDDLADLMVTSTSQVESAIRRLSQEARAAGIHLIIATQRPSTNVVTGSIKANLNTRISFNVSSAVDSITILDRGGAEELLEYGDFLYKSPEEIQYERIECAYIPEKDVKSVVDFIIRNNVIEETTPKKQEIINDEKQINNKIKNQTPVDDYILEEINKGTIDNTIKNVEKKEQKNIEQNNNDKNNLKSPVFSILAFCILIVSFGLLTPISLIFSIIALVKQERLKGLSISTLVICILIIAFWAFIMLISILGAIAGVSTNTV